MTSVVEDVLLGELVVATEPVAAVVSVEELVLDGVLVGVVALALVELGVDELLAYVLSVAGAVLEGLVEAVVSGLVLGEVEDALPLRLVLPLRLPLAVLVFWPYVASVGVVDEEGAEVGVEALLALVLP